MAGVKCPSCSSTDVTPVPGPTGNEYGAVDRVCGQCRTAFPIFSGATRVREEPKGDGYERQRGKDLATGERDEDGPF